MEPRARGACGRWVGAVVGEAVMGRYGLYRYGPGVYREGGL